MVRSSLQKESLARLTIDAFATILDAVRVVDEGGEGIAFVCDGGGAVLGTLTDGDIRRALLAGASLTDRTLESIMRREFVHVTGAIGRAEVLDIMRARNVHQVPVLDADRRLCGLHTVDQLISTVARENSVLILAGGRGTRLYPITETIPKPMVTVAGRPILERLVLHLMSHGIRNFHISVNYLAHVIEQHFGDGSRFGCRITYLRESKPLGTGGPLALIDPPPVHPLVVVNGDLVTECDIGRLIEFHVTGGYEATFGMKTYDIEIPYGVADVDGARLVGLREKPRERVLINAGIYCISPQLLPLVPRDQNFPITDLFAHCIRENRPVGAHLVEAEWLDVGRKDELSRARGDA